MRGLSVTEVLGTAVLKGSRVLAGATGLDRPVQRLNVMEVPDGLEWVKPHELLLTTGYPLRACDDLSKLAADLDDRGVSALAVKLGRYLGELPPEMLREADRRGFPVIGLHEDVAFDDILEQVLTDLLNRQAATLARAEEIHRALVQIVLGGGGLPDVASELVALLGGTVVIATQDGRVIADGGTVVGLPGNRVVVPIAAGRADLGRIVAFSASGSLGQDDVHLIERAATVSALALTKQLAVRAVESKYQGDFLRDLLSGQVPAEQAVSHAASLGWDVDRPVVVVVAELDPVPEDFSIENDRRALASFSAGVPVPGLIPRPALDRFAAAWQGVVRPRDPLAPVAGFNREVVAVLGVPARSGDARTKVDRLVRDLVREVSGDGGGGRRSFSTGVSRVVRGPAEVAKAYDQARTAVVVGRRMQGRSAVAHFDGLGVFRLLTLVSDKAELRSFAEETLHELAGDSPEVADLRHTLDVLLENNLNVAEAARVLHFHYNTLRYRIAKLEKMVGPFSSDPNLRLSLQVALQVLRLRPV
jgi:purine catabolism regulator